MASEDPEIKRLRAVLRRFERELEEQQKLKRRCENLIEGAPDNPQVASVQVARYKRTISRLESEIAANEEMIAQLRRQIADRKKASGNGLRLI